MFVRVCFVCLGNICRSPTAEGIFLALIRERGLEHCFEVDSAGTSGAHVGEPADSRAQKTAQARGFELPSISRQFMRKDFERFDYILAMDSKNKADLMRLAWSDEDREKVFLLRDFERTSLPPAHPARARAGLFEKEVPDPYYGGRDGFEEVFDMCEDACTGFLEHVIVSE